MKQILLLTDFSRNALNAIHYAMHLFKSETCTFHLMNVHKVGSYISDDLMLSSKESIYTSITKEPKEKLSVLVDALKEDYKNVNHTFETLIDYDVFIDAIKQAVKMKTIDYIIMGTNGASGTKEVLFGSNTINVIRKVDCKTIIIPEDYKFKPIRELLLPLDAEDDLKGNAFTEVLNFINMNKLHLHVLRINPNNESNENAKHDKSNLALVDCDYFTVDHVPIDYAVNSYLQTRAIDFMALIVQKEGFLTRFFSDGNANKMSLSKIKKPILVLHSNS